MIVLKEAGFSVNDLFHCEDELNTVFESRHSVARTYRDRNMIKFLVTKMKNYDL